MEDIQVRLPRLVSVTRELQEVLFGVIEMVAQFMLNNSLYTWIYIYITLHD